MPNVTYRELEATIDNLNIMKAKTTQYEYRTVIAGASNSPEPSTYGVCVIVPFYATDHAGNSEGNYIIQLYYSATGNVYTRTMNNRYGSENWGEWVHLGAGASTPNLSEYLKKPESQGQITDIDNPTESGFRKTGNETVSGTLPDGVDPNAKWGLVVNLFENTGNNTMFQMWFSLSGPTKGHRYTRGREAGKWTKWVDISSGGPSVNNVWKFPDSEATNIDNKSTNDYFYTTEQTAGVFPEGVSKHGIVKTTVTPAGFIQQKYTPLEGPLAGLEYTRTKEPIVTRNGERQDGLWTDWNNGQKSLEINKNTASINMKPYQYALVKDRVVYEYKFPSVVGLNALSDSNGFIVLKTLIADDIVTSQGEAQEQKYGYIIQYAYSREARVFTRHYKHPTGSFKPNEHAEWTDQWKEITNQGGGTGTSFDLDAEFKSWISPDTQSHPAQASFEAWHTKYLKAKFATWKAGQGTQQEKEEQKAFEDYVLDKLEKSGGRYQKWIDYYKNPNQ